MKLVKFEESWGTGSGSDIILENGIKIHSPSGGVQCVLGHHDFFEDDYIEYIVITYQLIPLNYMVIEKYDGNG
jgi:hypothetical protein